MSFDLPPVIKKAELVRSMVAAAVSTWSRAHRYEHGVDLRRQAKAVVKAAHQAWTDRHNRPAKLRELSDAIDELGMDMRLGQHLRQFSSWGQFDGIMQELRDLGRQCGALCKKYPVQQHSKGQNAAAPRAAAVRQDTEYPGRLNGANP